MIEVVKKVCSVAFLTASWISVSKPPAARLPNALSTPLPAVPAVAAAAAAAAASSPAVVWSTAAGIVGVAESMGLAGGCTAGVADADAAIDIELPAEGESTTSR